MGNDSGQKTVIVSSTWGAEFDSGYHLGRSDAPGAGASGLLAENERFRRALAIIGRRGEPLSGAAAKEIARRALAMDNGAKRGVRPQLRREGRRRRRGRAA